MSRKSRKKREQSSEALDRHERYSCDFSTCEFCQKEFGEAMGSDFPVIIGTKETSKVGAPTGGYTTTTWKSCSHDGNHVVFEFEGRQFVGAASFSTFAKIPKDAVAVLDLASNLTPRPRVVRQKIVKSVEFLKDVIVADPLEEQRIREALSPFSKAETVEEQEVQFSGLGIRLDWSDMDAAPVKLAFWNAMLDILPKGKIVVCCMGGHGRTGTALAALMLAATKGAINPYEIIEIVRERHCDKAVESQKQIFYLEDLAVETGRYELTKKGKGNTYIIEDLPDAPWLPWPDDFALGDVIPKKPVVVTSKPVSTVTAQVVTPQVVTVATPQQLGTAPAFPGMPPLPKVSPPTTKVEVGGPGWSPSFIHSGED